MAARTKYTIIHTSSFEVLYKDLTKTKATSLLKTLNSDFKMIPQPPANKAMEKKVLARRQQDLDGFVEKHQAILDARAVKYAQEIQPQWTRIKKRVSNEITAIQKELMDAQGVPITQQPIPADKARNMKRQKERLLQLEKQLEELIGGEDQVTKLTNNAAYSYTEAYYFSAFGLEQAAKVAIAVPVLTQGHVLGAIINPWLPDGATYSDRIRLNTKFLAKKMAGTVEEALGKGWSINRTAREIESRANEGYYNAVRLARTEMTRASAQGANHVYMQNADIMSKKRWNATLDGVTSPKCAQCDGQLFDLDYDTPENKGEPGKRIPNHPNCRCKWTPVLDALGVSTRERIARGANNERIYTEARTYKEYAAERGLPDIDDRVRNDDPRRYLRRGETLADIPKNFFDPFEKVVEQAKTFTAVSAAATAVTATFVPAKTIAEANTWAAENLQHIKKVDYKGFDIQLANAINEELYNLRQLYPEVEDINYVGTSQQRNKDVYDRQVAEFLKANEQVFKGHPQRAIDATVKRYIKKPKPIPANVQAQAANKSWGPQAGITFNQTTAKNYEAFKQSVEQGVSSKWSPVGTEKPVSILIHEFGHSIDYFLDEIGLRDKYLTPITKEALADSELGDKLSRYATTNDREVIAEAFAEYRLNPNPRAYARRVGEAIEQALDEYRRSKK